MTSASFLFVLWDGGGNVAPQLAIVRRLTQRGHRVTVLASRSLAARVQATGASFAAFSCAPDGDPTSAETDLIRDWAARTPLGAFARARDGLLFGPAHRFAQDVLSQLAREPADVAAVDFMLLGAALGVQAGGVPLAILFHTVYAAPLPGLPPFGLGLALSHGPLGRLRDALLARLVARAFAPGFASLNAAASRLGVPPVANFAEMLDRAERALVLTSPAFDFAARLPLPENVVFTGATIDRDTHKAWDSPWADDHPAPLVVASFSTTYMRQERLVQRVLDALAGLPVRGLLTTGPALERSELRAPANVVTSAWAPHAVVMPKASLVVTHGGLGTVHAALAAGTPLVCLPCGRDQGDNAARVVAAGAGVRLSPRTPSPRLRETIRAALADARLREGARTIASTMASEAGAERAADELAALAAGGSAAAP